VESDGEADGLVPCSRSMATSPRPPRGALRRDGAARPRRHPDRRFLWPRRLEECHGHGEQEH